MNLAELKLHQLLLIAALLLTATSAARAGQAPAALWAVSAANRITSVDGSYFYQVSYSFDFPGYRTVYDSNLGTVPSVGRYTYLTRSRSIEIKTTETGAILKSVNLNDLVNANSLTFFTKPGSAPQYLSLARANLSTGDPGAAIRDDTDAVALSHSSTRIAAESLDLASAYESLGDIRHARSALRTASKQDTDFKDVTSTPEAQLVGDKSWCGDSSTDALERAYGGTFDPPAGQDYDGPPRDVPWNDNWYFANDVDPVLLSCFGNFSTQNSGPIHTATSTYIELPGLGNRYQAEVALQVSGVYDVEPSPVLRVSLALREYRGGQKVSHFDPAVVNAGVTLLLAFQKAVEANANP